MASTKGCLDFKRRVCHCSGPVILLEGVLAGVEQASWLEGSAG